MIVFKKRAQKYSQILNNVKKEIAKVVVGQQDAMDALLRCVVANGHVLVEGIPGIAKTLMIRALGQSSGCTVKRVQFTVDLLPTDILGLTIYSKKKDTFVFVKGPIFANFIIADEINRAPPKTQSAMLEVMQEKQVTISRRTFPLDLPFFVMATMNPIETAGVNPLPEAQVDRFLFKLNMFYPGEKEEQQIMKQNITLRKFEDYDIKPVTSAKEIIEMQSFVKGVFVSKEVERYIVSITRATRQKSKQFPLLKYIEYGASPRATIAMYIGSKAEALINGSSHVTPNHVKKVAYDVLRHRILLNYAGQAEGISTDEIIKEVLSKIPVP